MAKLKDGFYKLTAEAVGSDSYMLLAGGGSKALSDFATASGVVTALGTNGNYVTWTKNGTANNLTVPYATATTKLSRATYLKSDEDIDGFLEGNQFKFAQFKTETPNQIGFAANDGMLLSIPWADTSYGFQMAFDDNPNCIIKARGKSSSWGDWCTLLHSGNTYINSGTITINGTNITPLTSHQSLANYVTLSTAQTITGKKTFNNSLTINSTSTNKIPKLVIDEYYSNTAGNWISEIISDYYGTNVCSKSDFTHGLYIKLGRLEFNNLIVLNNDYSPIARISKEKGHWFDGTLTTTGNITATGFVKSDSSDSYVLLGGGGHKILSDFFIKPSKTYSSLDGLPSGTEGWYKVGSISDVSGSGCIFMVRAYAHSSAIFTVSKGYSTSGNITVLQYCSSGNGSYAYVKAARLISDGTVEILLNKPKSNDKSYVLISVATYNADNVRPFDTLTLDDGSPEVIQTKYFTNDAITATNFVGDLSGNAATSDKLKTSRKLWGLDFDGSADVSGRLQVQDSWGIKVTNNNAENYGYFCTADYIGDVTDGGEMQLTGRHGLIVSSYGNYIYLQEAGNIGIGTTDPQYPLHVIGNTEINANGNGNSPLIINTPHMGYSGFVHFKAEEATIGKIGFFNYTPTIQDKYGNRTTILHTGNSSVSGGGSSGGSSITVNIGGTSKTLTIPTSLPANGGNADTVDGVHLEWSGSLAASDTTWIAGWTSDGTKLKAVKRADLSVNYANSAGSVAWGNVTGKPSSYTPSAHDHTRILFIDDRNVVETPTDVAGKNGIEIHFKDKSKSGITSTGTWTAVVMLDGYSDTSGGYPMELGFSMSDLSGSRPLYLRTPKSATEWGSWRTVLDSNTYTDFINTTNFAGLNKTGTVTSVTITQGTGITVSNSGTAITTSGTRTITLNSASSSAIGGIQLGYTASGVNIPLQTSSNKGYVALTKAAVVAALGYTPPTSDTNTDTKVTLTVTSSNATYPLLLAPSGQTATTTTTAYFDSGVTLNPSTNTIAANISGTAANATTLNSVSESEFFRYRGTLVSNTDLNTMFTSGIYANETGNGTNNSNLNEGYGYVLSFKAASSYYKGMHLTINSSGTVMKVRTYWANKWNSWKQLAFTSDIPTVTNYYWANVKISSSSNEATTPTFSTITTTGVSYVATLRPSTTNQHYLGSSNNRWNGVFSKAGNFSGLITLSVATGTSPFKITSTTVNTNLNADMLDGKHASDFAEASHSHSYLPLSGGTMTGNIVAHIGDTQRGIKFGSGYLNSLSNQLLWQSDEAIRFGSATWNWDAWAGLKYKHSNKIIYLGLADGTIFNANTALSGGKLYLPGISEVYTGNGTNKILHAGNSSVSGGGSSGGSSITVDIGGTSKTLTVPTSLPANGGNASTVSGYSIVVQSSRPTTVSNKQIIFVYE